MDICIEMFLSTHKHTKISWNYSILMMIKIYHLNMTMAGFCPPPPHLFPILWLLLFAIDFTYNQSEYIYNVISFSLCVYFCTFVYKYKQYYYRFLISTTRFLSKTYSIIIIVDVVILIVCICRLRLKPTIFIWKLDYDYYNSDKLKCFR